MTNNFAERRQFRERETVTDAASPLRARQRCLCGHFESCPACSPVMTRQPVAGGWAWGALKRPDGSHILQADADRAFYERHTVDISDPAPKSVEDELLVFERGWSHVKCWAAFVFGVMIGACVGYWVLPHWVHHG